MGLFQGSGGLFKILRIFWPSLLRCFQHSKLRIFLKLILNIIATIFPMFSMSLNKQTWHISFCRVVRETRDKYIGGIQQQCHNANSEVLHHTQEKEIVRKVI